MDRRQVEVSGLLPSKSTPVIDEVQGETGKSLLQPYQPHRLEVRTTTAISLLVTAGVIELTQIDPQRMTRDTSTRRRFPPC